MKTWMSIALLGMTLSAAACLSPDAATDPADETELETTTTESEIIRPHPGPDFYITCSDDPNVCRPPYGSVSIVPDASCIPFGSSHLVTCRYGSVSL
jgi:hypothetical protein